MSREATGAPTGAGERKVPPAVDDQGSVTRMSRMRSVMPAADSVATDLRHLRYFVAVAEELHRREFAAVV